MPFRMVFVIQHNRRYSMLALSAVVALGASNSAHDAKNRALAYSTTVRVGVLRYRCARNEVRLAGMDVRRTACCRAMRITHNAANQHMRPR